MKQLPLISSELYLRPWCVLPTTHAELGQLYRSYLSGNLPSLETSSKQVGSGVRYQIDDSGLVLLEIEGIIGKRVPEMLCGPQIADLQKVDQVLTAFQQNQNIKTIVIYFDSPGGVATGLEETSELIESLIQDGKRVVCYVDCLCASAAYWLAASTQAIYAAPSASVGSIGTYIAAIDDSRAWEIEGLELKIFRDGDLKALGHPGKAWTPEEEEYLQERLEQTAAQFKSHIATKRPALPASAQRGQTHIARSAPSGLVDGYYNSIDRLLADELAALAA